MLKKELVFNDCSLLPLFPSMESAEVALIDMSKGIAALLNAQISQKVLRCNERYFTDPIGATFTISDIIQRIQSNSKTKEEGILLRSLSFKMPWDSGLLAVHNERLKMIDFSGQNMDCFAFLLCIVAQQIAISLNTEAKWDADQINVKLLEMEENGEFKEFSELVDHLSRFVHADQIIKRHRERVKFDLNQNNFWQMRSIAFPNLDFGADVEKHITTIETTDFSTILKRLSALDITSAQWVDSGAAPSYGSLVTNESTSTMSQTELVQMRVFRDAQGNAQLYELHARYGSVGRIHIREIISQKRIEIGYIGHKLPTVLYRT